MGNSTSKRPRPTGLPRHCFQGSAGFPLGARVQQRCNSAMRQFSASHARGWVACVVLLLAVGTTLAIGTDLTTTNLSVHGWSGNAMLRSTIDPDGCATAGKFFPTSGHQDGQTSLRFSQPSNSLKDGPDTFLTRWLKSPVIAAPVTAHGVCTCTCCGFSSTP